ncbi:hypothetical protein VcTj87_21450 [Vibrio comitans]
MDGVQSTYDVPNPRHSGSLLAGSRPSGTLGSAKGSYVRSKFLNIYCVNFRMTMDEGRWTVDGVQSTHNVPNHRHSGSLLAGILEGAQTLNIHLL